MRRGLPLFILLIFVSFSFISHAEKLDPLGDYDNDRIKNGNDQFPKDYDNDGIPDKYEEENGLDPKKNSETIDTDSDGLYDVEEYELGTDPNNPDTDGDGILDGDEVIQGSNPRNSFSPFDIDKVINIILPILMITLFLLIFIYLTISNYKKEPSKRWKFKMPTLIKIEKKEKEEVRSNPVIKKIESKKERKSSFFEKLSKFLEIFLGPNISNHNKTKSGEEKVISEEENDEENIEDHLEDSEEIKDGKQVDPNSFLMKILNHNKRKNKIQDVFDYFDKEIKEEELGFLKEKKTKQEIIAFLNQRKEMKKKIIEELKEQKNKDIFIPKEEVKNKKVKEDTVFDKLEKISDEAYDNNFKK